MHVSTVFRLRNDDVSCFQDQVPKSPVDEIMVNGLWINLNGHCHHIIPSAELKDCLANCLKEKKFETREALRRFINRPEIKKALMEKFDKETQKFIGNRRVGKMLLLSFLEAPYNQVRGPNPVYRAKDSGGKLDTELLDKQPTEFQESVNNCVSQDTNIGKVKAFVGFSTAAQPQQWGETTPENKTKKLGPITHEGP